MARRLTVAALQMACGPEREANVARAERMVRTAAERGASIVLLPELFATPYFCKDQDPAWFATAESVADSPLVARFSALAAELEVVLPLSFFERAGQAYFNSLALIDGAGAVRGVYRKSHIPDGPGYQEKYYFTPGDTGFMVWDVPSARIGAAICWDQWFPEAARIMALAGAELLFYPTAIGSEPSAPEADTAGAWQLAMRGHAVCNRMPVIAANRIGVEAGQSCTLTFYGSSFIAGPDGQLLAAAGRDEEAVLVHAFDLDRLAEERAGWGFFRDRRPELYRPLLKP